MRTRTMTEKQLQIYGARIRLAWFRTAEELGSVTAACKNYGIARNEYYYWHKRWCESIKQLTSLYDLSRTPKSHSADLEQASLCNFVLVLAPNSKITSFTILNRLNNLISPRSPRTASSIL